MSSRAGWRRVKFGEIAESVTVRVDDPSQAGVERYVGLEHLDPESLSITRWGQPTDVEATKLRFWPGDIIFGRRRAYQRKLAVAEFEGICSAHALVLRARPDVALPEFLPFFMQSNTFFDRALSISVGSLSPTINWKTLREQTFSLPPIDEQREIAQALSAVQAAVLSYSTLLRRLEAARTAWRRRSFLHRDGWRRAAIGELYEVQLGKMLSAAARGGSNPKPYLANTNVQWDRVDVSNPRKMDFDRQSDESKFRLRPGDILVCEGGEVGRTAIWQGELEECYYQKALHRLRPLGSDLMAEIFVEFMHFAAESGLLARHTGHSTIAHLTAVKLRTLEIPVPPASEQEKLVGTLLSIKEALAATRECILAADSLRSGVLRTWIGA